MSNHGDERWDETIEEIYEEFELQLVKDDSLSDEDKQFIMDLEDEPDD